VLALPHLLRGLSSSVANLILPYTLPFMLPSENSVQLPKRVSWRAVACPEHPHPSCEEAGQGPGLVQQPLTAFPSQPPASPIPALSSQPGKAAAVSSWWQVTLTVPLPSRGMGGSYSLPLFVCSKEAKSKSRHFEGENLLNVTLPQRGL